MRILAIDTALDACAAAILDGGLIAAAVTRDIGRGHAEELMAVVSAVLATAETTPGMLDRIAVTVGPGSFTGIRVGLAAARGLALAVAVPVVGVTTLEAIAADVQAEGVPVLVVLDARRGEVYAQLFAPPVFGVVPQALGEAAALDIAEAAGLARSSGARLVGSGAALVAAAAGQPPPPAGDLRRFPDIAAVARLGAAAALPPGPPKPAYLRAADAKPQQGFRLARQADALPEGLPP